jgi:hypothetical protein
LVRGEHIRIRRIHGNLNNPRCLILSKQETCCWGATEFYHRIQTSFLSSCSACMSCTWGSSLVLSSLGEPWEVRRTFDYPRRLSCLHWLTFYPLRAAWVACRALVGWLACDAHGWRKHGRRPRNSALSPSQGSAACDTRHILDS